MNENNIKFIILFSDVIKIIKKNNLYSKKDNIILLNDYGNLGYIINNDDYKENKENYIIEIKIDCTNIEHPILIITTKDNNQIIITKLSKVYFTKKFRRHENNLSQIKEYKNIYQQFIVFSKTSVYFISFDNDKLIDINIIPLELIGGKRKIFRSFRNNKKPSVRSRPNFDVLNIPGLIKSSVNEINTGIETILNNEQDKCFHFNFKDKEINNNTLKKIYIVCMMYKILGSKEINNILKKSNQNIDLEWKNVKNLINNSKLRICKNRCKETVECKFKLPSTLNDLKMNYIPKEFEDEFNNITSYQYKLFKTGASSRLIRSYIRRKIRKIK